MKRNLFATFSLGALSALLTATSAYAQRGVEANVPFAFSVGATRMPAGTYRITAGSRGDTVTIRNCNSSAAILSLAQHEYAGGKSQKLVFRRVRDQYFLSEIWGEKGSDGLKLPAPKRETRLEVASQPTPSEKEVLIALK
jgi:hypothetical protein